MLGNQMLRSTLRGSVRASQVASTSRLTPTIARGYATTAEEVADIDPSLFSKKVDMSPMEAGKGFYVNYKRIEDNLKIVRQRCVSSPVHRESSP